MLIPFFTRNEKELEVLLFQEGITSVEPDFPEMMYVLV